MSDSEVSDDIGYVVEQSDHEESDRDGSDESGSGSELEDPAESNGLFDLEAADSDDESSGSGDSEGDERNDSGSESWPDNHFFPQFKRLPFELRHRIWEFFCPELSAKACVYWFLLQWGYRKNGVARNLAILEGPFLEQQTRPARAMLGLHQESRQLALKAFPDTLSFGSNGIVRFNAKRDVVLLGSTEAAVLDFDTLPPFPNFSEHIRHLAVEPATLSGLGDRASTILGAFQNLQTVHYLTSPTDHKPQHLRWCTSDSVKRYAVTTFEEQPGLGEDGQHLYCWPDLENHRTFAETKIPLDKLAEDLCGDDIHIRETTFNGEAIWPMIQFLWDSDQRRFGDLLAWDGEDDLTWESSDEEDDGEPDEYESEGIDDSFISEDSPGADESDLVVLDDDESDKDEERSEGGLSVLSGSMQPGGHSGAIDLTGNDNERIPGFSSPENSSATLRASDESANESDQPALRTSRLKRPRGRVVESDSEEGSEDDIPRKRARTNNRQNPLVLSSDDDEEDEVRKMRANQRARAVISEDEDAETGQQNASNPRDEHQGGGTDRSGTSDSYSSDEVEKSDEENAKPMSLAEKLQLHREKNPIPVSDDEHSEIEEMRGDDYDARDYADFQDDEEGDEISEEGEGDDEHGLTMDDEDEDDYGY